MVIIGNWEIIVERQYQREVNGNRSAEVEGDGMWNFEISLVKSDKNDRIGEIERVGRRNL